MSNSESSSQAAGRHTKLYAWLVWAAFVVMFLMSITGALLDEPNRLPWGLLAALLAVCLYWFIPTREIANSKTNLSIGVAGAVIFLVAAGILESGGGREFIDHMRANFDNPWRWAWFAVTIGCLAIVRRKKKS